MGLILEARSSVPFFQKSVAYGKAVEIDDSLQKPCRRGRTLFTLSNTSDRGRNLPGFVCSRDDIPIIESSPEIP